MATTQRHHVELEVSVPLRAAVNHLDPDTISPYESLRLAQDLSINARRETAVRSAPAPLNRSEDLNYSTLLYSTGLYCTVL